MGTLNPYWLTELPHRSDSNCRPKTIEETPSPKSKYSSIILAQSSTDLTYLGNQEIQQGRGGDERKLTS